MHTYSLAAIAAAALTNALIAAPQLEKFELTEAACHEEDRSLPHLKAIKDAAAGKK